jgi:antirestriction protein ArdC
MKNDVYHRVTTAIIAELEKGVRPWIRPWGDDLTTGCVTRPMRANMIPYQGINVLILWTAAFEKGFSSPTWMTFKQAAAFGGQVRKGERGSQVVFASAFARTEEGQDGTDIKHSIPFLKAYTVFNVEQIDGLPATFHPSAPPRIDANVRIERAEAFVQATGASIQHIGARALYSPSRDEIRMPPFHAFRDANSYYATLTHELIHWTGHPSRLNLGFDQKRFGDEGYAMEELVAELGSAFICADLGLTPELHVDNASYISSWLNVLKRDKRAIFTAASHAQRSASYLNAFNAPIIAPDFANLQSSLPATSCQELPAPRIVPIPSPGSGGKESCTANEPS